MDFVSVTLVRIVLLGLTEAKTPCACPHNDISWIPVCGTDGVTYDNIYCLQMCSDPGVKLYDYGICIKKEEN
ncbi:unnamed protein product, partial [Brenthis ino]